MTLLEPHPVLFWQVTAHGFFFALAASVAAFYFAHMLAKAKILRFVEGFEAAVLIFIIGLFGARFGYLVTYRSEWVSFGQVFAVWQGGLVSFWGIGASLLFAWWRSSKFSPEQRTIWWDQVILAGLLGWSIGRLGNYYGADSVGIISAHWVHFYGRVPIQLFESLGCLITFFALRRRLGVAYLGILLYLITRLIIDTWRDEALFGPLHISQWTALLAIIIILPLYVRRRAR